MSSYESSYHPDGQDDQADDGSFLTNIMGEDSQEILIVLLVGGILFFLSKCIHIIPEYQRAIILRLGRLRSKNPYGPGLFYAVPWLDEFTVFDLRTQVANVPCSEILTKDSLTLNIDAVILYKVIDPLKAKQDVADYKESTILLGATTLRNTLGTQTMSEILFGERNSTKLMDLLNQETAKWGIVVEKIELQNISLPHDIQRAMAAEAEAEKKSKAKVISAEGEMIASRNLKLAADIMSSSDSAIQLRYLQTLQAAAASGKDTHTIVTPLPLEMLDIMDGKNPIDFSSLFSRLPSYITDGFRFMDSPPAYNEVSKRENTSESLNQVKVEIEESSPETEDEPLIQMDEPEPSKTKF